MTRDNGQLRLRDLLIVEVLLSIAIIGVAVGEAGRESLALMRKAWMSESFGDPMSLREAATERFSITGSFAGDGGDSLPYGYSGETSKAVRAQFSANERNGVVLVAGTVPSGKVQVSLAFHAAVDAEEQPFNVLWLCGDRQAPPGWVEEGREPPAPQPLGLAPSICRNLGIQ
jgi:hypothetical protein